jgi:FkbH-like protein
MSQASTTVASRLDLSGVLSAADYHRIARSLEAQPDPRLSPLRVAFLSSYTATFLKPFLTVEAARRHLLAKIRFGSFGQFEQEIDPSSDLWTFAPDVLVIAMRPEDVDIEAVERYHATSGQRFASLAESMVGRIAECARAARKLMKGPIVVANIAPPAFLPLGPFDASIPGSLSGAIEELNRRLTAALKDIPGAFVWDYAGLVRSRGSGSWTDPRMWSLARAAIAQEHQPACAAHLMRTIASTMRPSSKCLVLDLDNTLWGGVLGDDGPGGIQLGDDHPGSAYKQLQRVALSLMDRGILLAVSSKNNPDIVEQTLRTHPEMVLRWDDFACVKANWRSKSENLREIAAELNIGVDALVLFDDNPVERAEVRAALPMVGIVEVPTEPTAYAAALHNCEFFDQPTLQAEDRERAAMYRRERERRELEAQATSPTEFLETLQMEAEVGRADDQTLGRIAQLIGKTNQFNLTTRRHSQADVAAMASDPEHIVAWLRLRDRFGDQGLVVVGVVKKAGTTAEIDTFLMSCRVMNRRVEQAFMSYLLEHARALGCTTSVGTYLPTPKNGMVAEFYPGLGFTPDGEVSGGGRRYTLDMVATPVPWPDVIRRRDAGS